MVIILRLPGLVAAMGGVGITVVELSSIWFAYEKMSLNCLLHEFTVRVGLVVNFLAQHQEVMGSNLTGAPVTTVCCVGRNDAR